MDILKEKYKGVFFIIMSALGFALMSAFVKLAGDIPSIQKTLFRNIISCLVALFFVIKNKQLFFGKKENQKVLILRSTLGTLGILLNFYAIDYLILSDSNMLNKISPFFVIIFSAIILKEKVNKTQIIAIIIAFLGALFIIKPTFQVDLVPYLAGILGAVFAAGAYTCLRYLGNRESHYTIVFYFSLFSTLVIAPFVVFNFQPMSVKQLIYMILAGIFASMGQFGVTLAYKYAPAREISIFDYSNIIFSAILGFFLFKAIPDKFSIIGYLVIFGASYYMFKQNKKR